MKVWVYESRCDSPRVFVGNHVGWILARTAQDEDNRCSLEDVKESGSDFGGSEEEGYLYIDDGGVIRLVEIEGLDNTLVAVDYSDGEWKFSEL